MKLIYILYFILILFLATACKNEIVFSEDGSIEKLASLPYLQYSTEKTNLSKTGVTIYNPELAYDGYNLYENILMDMQGNIIHIWPTVVGGIIMDNGDFIGSKGIIPENWNLFKSSTNNTMDLRHIVRVDLDSNILWEKNMPSHHEITKNQEGNIIFASKEIHEYNGRDVEFDTIVEISPDGDELWRWSTFDNLQYLHNFHEKWLLDLPKLFYIPKLDFIGFRGILIGGDYDYYHLNSIQSLPNNSLSKSDLRFKPGNLLISFAQYDLIAILDRDKEEIVWTWGPGEIQFQHTPRMLDNGNILIFDNGLRQRYNKDGSYNILGFLKLRKYSRVIELDPIKKEIVWEYKGTPPESFFSHVMGSSQRLPNGNTLIVDSMSGRSFEITNKGEIVWEWFNPNINDEGHRENIYRMTRIEKDIIEPLLIKKSLK